MDTSALREALSKAAARLQTHREVYQRNETAVREQIVLPVLRGLGWDVEDPDQVHPEEPSDVGFPDYVLKLPDRPVLTIEVKNTGIDLTQPGALRQAHRYASEKGIELCLATNGETWLLARSFESGRDLSDRILWQFLLSEETLDGATSRLSMIAKANVGRIGEFVGLQDRLSEEWDRLIEDSEDLVNALVNLVKERLGAEERQLPYPQFIEDFVRQRVRDMLTQREAEPEAEPEGGAGPRGGARRGHVKEVLLAAAEQAIREGRLGPTDRIESGRSRYLVSPTPRHKDNKSFFSPVRLSNGLYLETHCGMERATRLAAVLADYGRRRHR